jgi:hypothetical protein
MTPRNHHVADRAAASTKLRFSALLVLCTLAVIAPAAVQLPETIKIIFPSQDDQNGYTGSGNGCDMPGQVLLPLERFVASEIPQNYLRYDLASLNRRGVPGVYYIYSKEACRKLLQHFPANVFVMARVKLRRCEELPDGSTRSWYDVQAKVCTIASGRETIIFRQQNVSRDQIAGLLRGKEHELFQSILAIAQPPGSS